MKKRYLLFAGMAAMLFASCSDDVSDAIAPVAPVDGIAKMQVITGSQDGRIKTAPATRGLSKWRRLEWVATIKNPEVQGPERKWSATAVAFDESGREAYITWHSDRQAKNQAKVWGGAIDVVNIADEAKGNLVLNTTGTIDGLLKFNNVLPYKGSLYLSATSARVGGTVGRIRSVESGEVECIGFPGNSVNAVAPYGDNKLIAVSGYSTGTYAAFDPDMPAQEMYDETSSAIQILNEGGVVSGFGGKYVATDETGKTYVLYDPADGYAQIQEVGATAIDLGVDLVSEEKYAEIYSESGGWQEFEVGSTTANYYGKHVLAVKDGYAYVGAGKNGLRMYNIGTQKVTWSNSTNTIGVYADDDYVYAATGAGLRVYKRMACAEGDTLELYAYEVAEYDAEGTPIANQTVETGSDNADHHSPNFVAAHKNSNDGNIYIYIAYGQSGVRVYRFRTEKEPESVDVGTDDGIEWATEDLPGYYAWGEIFHADNTDADDAAADAETLTFTSPDGKTYTNNEGYYAAKGPKKAYTPESYVFYDKDATPQTGTIDAHAMNTATYKIVKMLKYFIDTEVDIKGYKNFSNIHAKDYGTLRPEDDAATMRLGDGWRMPTAQEFNNMLEQIDSQSETEQDGKNGILLSFKNGSKLFFPFSGTYTYKTDDDEWMSWWGSSGTTTYQYEQDNSVIYRWTSTLISTNQSAQMSTCNKSAHGYEWLEGLPGMHWDVGGKNECYWSYEAKAVFGGLSLEYDYEQEGTDAQRERWCGMKIRPVREK